MCQVTMWELFQQPKAVQLTSKTCHKAKIYHNALGFVTLEMLPSS